MAVRRHAEHVLVIDDGSTDDTPVLLARQRVDVMRHAHNRGYGRSMQDMLRQARYDGFDWLISMDCDEQHEPDAIPSFVAAMRGAPVDVISGSRYLAAVEDLSNVPGDRRSINRIITDELNARLDLSLTDAFCGFKAYRTAACERLTLDVDGYDFPMQFWVQAVARGLSIAEIPVRLIYNDPTRTFGGPLSDPVQRLEVYRRTLHREIGRVAGLLPARARTGLGLPLPAQARAMLQRATTPLRSSPG